MNIVPSDILAHHLYLVTAQVTCGERGDEFHAGGNEGTNGL